MKKWVWYAIGIIVVLAVAGGFFIHYTVNASTYKNSMENGRTEIKNKQYNAAQTNFQKAAQIKPNSMEANNLLSQTSKFVDGENKFKDYDFNGASDSFNDVISYDQGSSILEKRAKLELKVIKQVSGKVTKLEKIYNEALKQNKNKEFDDSNATLEAFFDEDLPNNSFYAPLIKEAKKLKAANDDHVVLNKYKAKKTSNSDNDSEKKPKKSKKITKASKDTSDAIDDVTSTVAPTVASSSDDTSSTPASTAGSSDNTVSTPARGYSGSGSTTSNYQPATPAPVAHHTGNASGSSDDNTPTAPASKPDNSSSQGTSSSNNTSSDSQGSSTTSGSSEN